MTIAHQITALLSGPVNHRIRKNIEEIGANIKCHDLNEQLLPDFAFEVVGLKEEEHPGHDFVGEKEYYYFEHCWNAVQAYKSGDTTSAVNLLMQAKWDFDDWALAHYLLGCMYLQQGLFKAALDQFEASCTFEPFNHRPSATMRELARWLTLNP